MSGIVVRYVRRLIRCQNIRCTGRHRDDLTGSSSRGFRHEASPSEYTHAKRFRFGWRCMAADSALQSTGFRDGFKTGKIARDGRVQKVMLYVTRVPHDKYAASQAHNELVERPQPDGVVRGAGRQQSHSAHAGELSAAAMFEQTLMSHQCDNTTFVSDRRIRLRRNAA
jgi:hypothetical protein